MGADGFIVKGKNNICGHLEILIEINNYAIVTNEW
jgi:hypothetical protein